MDKPPEKKIDPIIKAFGADLGTYQLLICLFIFWSKPPSGWVQISHVFLVAPVDASCTAPVNITDPCSDKCEKVEYDQSVFKNTIVTEWDLICKRKHLASISQLLLMLGVLIGSMFFGALADRIGRRPAFVLACCGNLVAGCLVSATPWFFLYCILRFFLGAATGGMMVVSFALIMEMVGPKFRETMAILYQIPFNLGHATLPLFAHFLREWRLFHLSFSSVSITYLLYICFLPESARWLFTTGNLDKSIEILEKGAACNKKPTETIRADIEAASAKAQANAPLKKGTMVDLFRYPNLRIKSIVMAFDWFVICLTYYGVAQYLTTFKGDIFVNQAIASMLGVPGTIICVPLTRYLGRKATLIASNSLSAFSLIAIAFVPTGNSLQIFLASMGLFGASVTFPNVYLFGGEIFPTVVRSSGIGLCSMTGRVGSMLSPFVSNLADVHKSVPALFFGIFSLAAALLTFMLPETRGHLLPETIEDGEKFGKKVKADDA